MKTLIQFSDGRFHFMVADKMMIPLAAPNISKYPSPSHPPGETDLNRFIRHSCPNTGH